MQSEPVLGGPDEPVRLAAHRKGLPVSMLRTFASLRVVARSAATAVFVALLVSAPATAQAPADGQPKAGGTVPHRRLARTSDAESVFRQ